jgi:hypothetical protein
MRLIKPGLRLKSAVCSTEVMVIRAPAGEALIACGGAEMLGGGDAAAAGLALERQWAQGSLIGKRYVDPEDRYELLCTKAGEGALSLNGVALEVKQAKALPSSD